MKKIEEAGKLMKKIEAGKLIEIETAEADHRPSGGEEDRELRYHASLRVVSE